ncbi:FUSC family protein [Pinirhizobacter soli]|uniref:FUSC family protein n=2 Tax=Pinirhizobacter soli TaxID=2786953 RepID=UPI002029C240|nr:FUSC family protein [Pinirhizobacter soli]
MPTDTIAPPQDPAVRRGRVAQSLAAAVVTMLAALATLACALAITPEPGPAVLAVVLCLSFSRSHLDHDLRGRLEAAVALPLVGLVAVGVGGLLHHMPWVGAVVFVAGMFVSIWVRRFGLMAKRAGSLLALPFVVILTTPHMPATHGGHLRAILIPIIVALLALAWVAAFQAAARSLGILPPPRKATTAVVASPPEGSLRPSASTRMAIQMAVALAASFFVGYLFFTERWAWIVLTAFIVNSGNRGRLDVAYKSVLRVAGASAGTMVALTLAIHVGGHDAITAALILAALFLGLWLRPLNYAWWALFITIALALLQGFSGATAQGILWTRLEEIVIGALIGVASAWAVYPVKSTAVLRRRIADTLAALSDAFDPATEERKPDAFVAALDQVEQVAPAFRASRLFTPWLKTVHPADWIDALFACRNPAMVLINEGATPGEVRKSVGAARRAMREPETLLPALQALRDAMATRPG